MHMSWFVNMSWFSSEYWLRYYEAVGDPKYLECSEFIHNFIEDRAFLTTCGGAYQWGSWCGDCATYQNSIIQELMTTFHVRIHVHRHGTPAPNSTLVKRASHLWKWMKNYTIDEEYLAIDGIDSFSCKVRPTGGDALWTYNQGVSHNGLRLGLCRDFETRSELRSESLRFSS